MMFSYLSNRRFGFAAFVVTMIAVFVIWDGASREPFVIYRFQDLLEQVVAGGLLLLFIGYLLTAFVFGLVRGKLSPWLSLLAFWLVVVGFYLWECPAGYLQDMAHYHWQTTFNFPQ